MRTLKPDTVERAGATLPPHGNAANAATELCGALRVIVALTGEETRMPLTTTQQLGISRSEFAC